MECAAVREAISAGIDGEDSEAPAEAVRHLAGCPGCRSWQQAAHALTRASRLGGVVPPRDLTAAVLAAAGGRSRAHAVSGRRLARAVLVIAAAAQLLFGLWLLVSGEPGAGEHAGHEIASFDLGLAAAFWVGALRPRWSTGLVWPAGVAAAALVVTAIADLVAGQAIGLDEVPHLVAVAGSLALAWQAGPGSRSRPRVGIVRVMGRGRSRSRAAGRVPAGPGPVVAEPPAVSGRWRGGAVA